MLTAIISVLGINGLTSFYKSVQDKYTTTQIHLVVFVLSTVATIIWAYAQVNPSLMTILEHIAVLGTASIGTYEAVWARLGQVISTPTA